MKSSSRLFVVAVFALTSVANLQFSIAALTITPTFTANFNANFGVNAAAAQASWIAAANVITSNFNDNIHINITVDAVAGSAVFGQSNTSLIGTSYASMRAALNADKKSADDITALGAGGSLPVAAPAAGTWWVSRSEAKAIGLIADDLSNDGTTTFGAGNNFTFSGSIAGGTFDFKGVALHEITEVMGRIGLKSATDPMVLDAFAFTGAGARDLAGGANNNFSIDNGTTLLKLWNNPNSNGLDSRDWAPSTNDAFNQFSNPGVVNGVSAIDLRVMDVIGYDLVAVPEPSSFLLTGLVFSVAGFYRSRAARRAMKS